ncbi:MAG: radical SAM family heme chaperone HemW [Acidobacteria bacterium]|nr:radical SAM family heme chaperone HemW [Acidobacteriota bacterium]
MIGLYIHVPYCSVRCSYCDFYLVTARGRELGVYVDALCGEIASVRPPLLGRAADTVHFGGGTPSLLAAGGVSRVLAAIRGSFALLPDAEIALEVNPEDVDEARIEGWKSRGINRLSIGVQCLDDGLLRLMRRPHDARRAVGAVLLARQSPIRSVGVDLILGLPGQDPAGALEGVERVIDLGVDHVSLYLLEVHERTLLGREIALGRRAAMDDDALAALYEAAADRLAACGFEHYEISNFARPGHRSRHNLKYWTDEDYLGFGPSAHSYVLGRRWSNAARLDAYIAARGAAIDRAEEDPSRARRAAEALIAGLRLSEGVDLAALRGRYGVHFAWPRGGTIEELMGAGLLERGGERLRLTRRGRLVSNAVLEQLLPDPRPLS